MPVPVPISMGMSTIESFVFIVSSRLLMDIFFGEEAKSTDVTSPVLAFSSVSAEN